MQFNFENKTVIITGATRGIGESIAQKFNELNATLILTGTDHEVIKNLSASNSDNENIRYIVLDYLKPDTVKNFFQYIRNLNKIDICINNAGINRINYVHETSVSDWDDINNVNLRGPFLLLREVSTIMKRQRSGKIINISSIFGHITREKRIAYTTSKAGLIGLTKTAAIELAPYNVLVNSISPGFIETELTKNILSEKEIEDLALQIPMKRFGQAEEIANAILFFASEYNTYITGQNLFIDGGFIYV